MVIFKAVLWTGKPSLPSPFQNLFLPVGIERAASTSSVSRCSPVPGTCGGAARLQVAGAGPWHPASRPFFPLPAQGCPVPGALIEMLAGCGSVTSRDVSGTSLPVWQLRHRQMIVSVCM